MNKALLVGALVAVTILVMAAVGVVYFSDRLTDPEDPLAVSGDLTVSIDEFPHPTAVAPTPTIRPTPHGHDPDSQPARLGVLYNTLPARGDIDLDTDGNQLRVSFDQLDELPIVGIPSNDGWHIHIPSCRHVGTYPAVRYVIGLPVRNGTLAGVTINGFPQRGAFIDTPGRGGTGPALIGPEDDRLAVYITDRQVLCEANANQEMTIHGSEQ